MNFKLSPKKHRPDREHPVKGRWRDRITMEKSIEAIVGLPTIDLSIPWYRRERFQKIAGLSGAIGGAVLAFVPGAAPLGEIIGGLGLTSWGTAAQMHRIKRKRAIGENTWLDVLLELLGKLLEILRKKK